MAKSGRSTSKSAAAGRSKSAAGRPARGAAASKPASRVAVKAGAKQAGATATRAKAGPPARAGTKRGVAAKSGDAARKPSNAKPAAKAARKSPGRSRIVVKVGSFGGPKPGSFGFNGHSGPGGGLTFLSGKPGSAAGSAGSAGQPRLTRTKLSARELRHFRDLLVAKRRQLLGDVDSMESEALRVDTSSLSHLPVHLADMGTDNYEQEFTLSLVDRERKLIDEIDHALRKIDERTYGICEGTGQMIAKERLEAQPWARFSIEHARRLQRPGVRR